MFTPSKALIACFLPLVLAQYGPPAGGGSSSSTSAAPPSTTSASTPGVQTVTVGANNGLTFSPNTISAPVGSSVEFVFYPPVHSVAQSSFASPCTSNNTQFFSGFFNTSGGTNANVFTITINDTNPIWFYCAFPSHCSLGMAGVINAPSDGSATLAQYVSAAAKVSNPPAPAVVQGGTIGPAKAASTGSSTSSAATSSSTKSAGVKDVEAGRGTHWLIMGLTGMFAIGVGSLII